MRASIEIQVNAEDGDRTLYIAALWIIAGALLSSPPRYRGGVHRRPAAVDAQTFISLYRAWHHRCRMGADSLWASLVAFSGTCCCWSRRH